MLFHIEHVHTEDRCPYHRPEIVPDTFAKVLPGFEAAGATVVGAFIDPPAHTVYLVVEASDMEQLRAGLGPIIDLGAAEIHPVTELAPFVERIASG